MEIKNAKTASEFLNRSGSAEDCDLNLYNCALAFSALFNESFDLERYISHIQDMRQHVEDIYQKCEDLQNKGVTILRPPRDGYMAFIKSPDGISVELLQKGQPQPVKEPWKSQPSVGSW